MSNPNLLTTHDLNAKYPVGCDHRADPFQAWHMLLRKWRSSDPQLLVENKHYIVRRDVWPLIYVYSEPKVLRLIYTYRDTHAFCNLLYTLHGPTMLSVLSALLPLDTIPK